MTLKNKSSWNSVIIALTSIILVIVGLSVRYDFYYDLNDDTTIRDIISGIYSGKPSGYNIQMLYPFSVLVAFFYKLFPAFAWYGLIMCGLQFLCITLILNRVFNLFENEKIYVQVITYLLAYAFIFGLAIRYLVFLQYTFTCGLLMLTATFLFMTCKSEKPQILPAILVIIAFALRTEMCLMMFVFLGVAAIVGWIHEKENTKKYLGTLIIALAGMAILYGANEIAYRVNPGWQEYREFFNARTEVYDFYGIPDYEENKALYDEINLSKEEYGLLVNYNFALDDNITTETLEKIAAYQKENQGTKNNLREAVWCYKEQILNLSNGIFSEIILIAYFLYLFLIFRTKKVEELLRLLFLATARSAIWIYLLKVDRALDRVTYPLLIVELVILITWLGRELKKENINNYFKTGFYLVALLCVCSVCIENIETTETEYNEREEIAPVYNSLLEYTENNPQNFYLLDVFSTTSYKNVVISEKIFKDVDNSYRNFDLCGGWLAKSPFAKSNEAETKLLKGEAYFIAYADKDMLWITEYFDKKGVSVDIETLDFIGENDENIYAVYGVHKVD